MSFLCWCCVFTFLLKTLFAIKSWHLFAMMFHWSNGHNPPYLPVRGVYCLHTDLGAHRHDIACFVHAEHSLHSSWVRNTDSDPVLVMCVPFTSLSAKCFASARLCFKIPIVTCSVCHTHYIISFPPFNCPKNPQNSCRSYRASICSALTTYGVHTDQHPK